MSKATLKIEIEVDLSEKDPRDNGMDLVEIVDIACGGINEGVMQSLDKSHRNAKIIKSSYTHTYTKNLA